MSRRPPVLLSDEQVQRFIADGFIELQSDLASDFHASVTEELSFALKHESRWLGDNLVPRVPILEELLESPVLTGALQSLLGPEFAWTPHRFPHNSEPIGRDPATIKFDPFENQPAMGEGSISGSGWHQDGHSKGGRSRWHTCRAINVFYFPHDTPIQMGPTRLLAGSHLYATLRNIIPEQVVFGEKKAGSIIVADFDLGHAGTPNQTEESRYMLKFVALRMQNPKAPSWKHKNPKWVTPSGLATPDTLPSTWQSLWNWLRAVPRNEDIDPPSKSQMAQLLGALAARKHDERLEALYGLVSMGAVSVDDLVAYLIGCGGKERHVSPAVRDPGYHAMAEDPLERRFSQRQFVPEDAAIALGAIGKPAMTSVRALLNHKDPWIRMNAVYAIGEMGFEVSKEIADEVGELLDDPLDCVVRVALDALCSLTNFGEKTVNKIVHLMTDTVEPWQYAAMGEPKLGGHWTIQNQIRYVASWVLRARVLTPNCRSSVEAALIAALAENTGYTPAVACQALQILGTHSALNAAIEYLSVRRWDPASFQRRPTRKSSRVAA